MLSAFSPSKSQRAPIHSLPRLQGGTPPRFGKAGPIQRMEEHYNRLDRDLNAIFQKAEKEPVTENRPAPRWIKDMEQLASEHQRWEKSVFDFMAEEPKQQKKLQFLQQQYNDYSLFQEKNPPKAPPALSETQKGNDYSQATGTFSDLEARVSGMGKDSNAIFIGSGPQPNTVLTYAKHAGQVTGADIDGEAVQKARQVVARLNNSASGAMDFVHQDGQMVDFKPFSHVTIASMVPNAQKVAMMRRISETANPGTLVTIRTTGGLKQAMYAPFTASEEELKGFNQVATILGPKHVINRSVVYATKAKPPSFSALA